MTSFFVISVVNTTRETSMSPPLDGDQPLPPSQALFEGLLRYGRYSDLSPSPRPVARRLAPSKICLTRVVFVSTLLQGSQGL